MRGECENWKSCICCIGCFCSISNVLSGSGFWLTQRWTRAVLDRAYKTGPYGLVGNEDVGQMSAWYVLAAFGLHPVCPGDPVYIITSPLFPKATIRLDPAYTKGGTFTVIAKAAAPGAVYIHSATLNGKPLNRAWITHQEIANGGTLALELVPEPDRTWGTDLPPSLVDSQPSQARAPVNGIVPTLDEMARKWISMQDTDVLF